MIKTISFLFLSFFLFSSMASARVVNFGVLTGVSAGTIAANGLDDETAVGLEFGPVLYFNLNPKLSLRSALIYKASSVRYDDDRYWYDNMKDIDFSQFLLSFGVQVNLNRLVSLYGDLNYSLDTSSEECFTYDNTFNCQAAVEDFEDHVLYLKPGVSLKFVSWFRLEPYFIFSLTDLGEDLFEETFQIGTNAVFAF